ncbi:AzlD domain-containing protein [Dehalobacterium formicoaceticum]|uniref:AzlD domain-containing protein n=1 Tax=Dehalobacterium formicoaceticum TaxID=51515 RepID=A0ABT1Y567_9FIRM|nr:AzlD domain-containing protein [Dehalobacterium formicoaceticum]MCR6545290.1 AzlD domain-containing protein [Dehalobacterium formicoaceticum]
MDSGIIILILALGGTNFLIRFLPAAFLNKITLPKVVEEWLSYVPVATMAALVVPEIFQGNGQVIYFSLHNFNLLSALPTIFVAAKTRNLGYTLGVGIGTMALLNMFAR